MKGNSVEPRRGAVARRNLIYRGAAVVLMFAGLYLAAGGPEASPPLARPAGPVRLASAEAKPRETIATKPIQQVRVGDRVLAGNPEGGFADESEVDPPNWRRLDLVLPKPQGGDVEMVLLRPVSWVDRLGARPGATIQLKMHELDLVGPARVLSVGPCPTPKPGSGRVVTGTFAHDSATVLDLALEGLDRPIGVTAQHPFYSEDREAFIPAGDLRLGERLRPLDGATHVLSVAERPGRHRVYNLEVNVDHVYHVTSRGVLVHNEYTGPAEIEISHPSGAGIIAEYNPATKDLYIHIIDVPEAFRRQGISELLYKQVIEQVVANGGTVATITGKMAWTNRALYEATGQLASIPRVRALAKLGYTVAEFLDEANLVVRCRLPGL